MPHFFELPDELIFEKIFSYLPFSEQVKFSLVSKTPYEKNQFKNKLLRDAVLLADYLFYSEILGYYGLLEDLTISTSLIDWLKNNLYVNKISKFIQKLELSKTLDNEKQVALLQACNNQEKKCVFSNNIGTLLKSLQDIPEYIKEGDFIIFELISSRQDKEVPNLFKTLCDTYPNSNWKYKESCSNHERIKSCNAALLEKLSTLIMVFRAMIQCNTINLFDYILKKQPYLIKQSMLSHSISLLHLAIYYASPKMLEYFITKKADIHIDHGPCIYPGNVLEGLKFNKNQKTFSPLFLSIALLFETKNENQIEKLGEIISILLKNGANPFQKAINWFYDAELESCPEYETVEYCKKELAKTPLSQKKEEILKSVIAHAEQLNANQPKIL